MNGTTNKSLCLFTINFPIGGSESFLYPEVLNLARHFQFIYIFPMECLQNEVRYKLPENVKVVKFNMFEPYNRLKILFSKPGTIIKAYFLELLHSKNRFQYFTQFFSSLNNLTHKISAAKRLETELNKIGLQNIILYTYWFYQWTFVLSLIKEKKNELPLFTRIHGMDVYEEQHTEKNFFFQFRYFQLGKLNRILSISKNGKSHLLQNNKLNESKIEISRLGVKDNSLNRIENLPFTRIVSCSYLQKYKRVHLIVEILKQTHSPIEWVHFGDGELQNDILEKSKELPSTVSFRFMGHKSNDEIINFYQQNQVDLFINTSETEGIPVSIMEAISFGVNAIAPNIGGVAEIVTPETGYLIKKDFSPNAVSEMIENHIRLSSDEKNARRNKARLFWDEHYNAEKNYTQLAHTLLQN